MKTKYSLVLPLAVLLGVPAVASERPKKEGRDLIRDMREQAYSVLSDANTLDGQARSSQTSWELVDSDLSGIKGSVNQMGRDLKKLEDMKMTLSLRQQRVVERVEPILRTMADDTTMSIRSVDQIRPTPLNEDLRHDVEKLSHDAQQLRSALHGAHGGHSKANS